MVMLKRVLVSYCFCIFLVQMSVSIQNPSRFFHKLPKNTGLDFQRVLQENINVTRMHILNDKCPLRINGGVNAGRSSVPYQVALRKELRAGRQWVVFCGGAIITNSYVLTAVRCFDSVKIKKIIIIAGAEVSDIFLNGNLVQRLTRLRRLQALESWRKIKTCHGHADYDSLQMINNFAVLEVNKPFAFSNAVQPVKILSYEVEQYHLVTLPESTSCLVSGYGLMQNRKTEVLQMVCLPLVNINICERVYPNKKHPKLTQICAGNDAGHRCPGDYGGPMVCKGFLVGIVSYGGEPGKVAGVYTRLKGYTDKTKKVEFYRCSSITMHYSLFEIMMLVAFTSIYNIFTLFVFL